MDDKFFGFQRNPFSVTPDPDFFYTNPVYQEALETLRYGIENRKGLMIVTGEVGMGKTVLLRKLMCSLEATARSVFIFNTDLGFFDLLRIVFRDLGLKAHSGGPLAMVEEFRNYLIAQFEKGGIVSLLIDEAQNLSDEAFEGIRFLSHLETDKESLLQIVLAGQPELQTRLDQPQLHGLKQRIALQCRLSAIEDQEVGSYIDFRLKSANYEEQGLFSPGAVERIAFYSRGSPRLINTICDNGLRVAYGASQKEVNPEMIDQVAGDLRLKGQTGEKKKFGGASFSETKGNDNISGPPIFHRAVDKSWESNFKTLPTRMDQQTVARRQGRSSAVRTGVSLALLLFAGASMSLTSERTRAYLWDLQMTFKQILGFREEGPLEKKMPPAGSDIGRVLREKDLPASSENRDVAPLPEKSKPATAPVAKSAPSKSARTTARDTKRISQHQTFVKAPADPEAAQNRLQLQVAKAINQRSITGVEISVNGNLVYLDGRVEFEAQKFAAERAARNVPGVKYVRNRIVVDSLPTY